MISFTTTDEGVTDDGYNATNLSVTFTPAESIDIVLGTPSPLLLIQPGTSESEVLSVLTDIRERQERGEGTPVRATHVDELNIRELLLELALRLDL